MNINNLYNFKNTIRFFLNINSIIFQDNTEEADIKNLSWSEPFKFRIKKQDDKYRTLKIPNILNFKCAYEHFKDMPNFSNVNQIDNEHKRLVANIETGDFVSGEFDRQLEEDFENLCIYDNLIKLDIKNYYGSIYTHKIQFLDKNENFLTNLNCGATNGLIMGNYLSLYFAELYLGQISEAIRKRILEKEIDCKFKYFSDDFYFYCNKFDNNNIIQIFDEVLESFDLERSDEKKEYWTYESYNNNNIMSKYWKKIIYESKIRFQEKTVENTKNTDNKLYFINQLIYRMAAMPDNKLKKIFINNFFKMNYFRQLDTTQYTVKEYDYHQLCFIFKSAPEAMLYAIKKFYNMRSFDNNRVENFLKKRYKEALKTPFHDEQLYFYFAIKVMKFNFLRDMREEVLESNNQILISYYLKEGFFLKEHIKKLKLLTEEKYWFQNYHLILYLDSVEHLEENIKKYLIPKNVKRERQKLMYLNFYKQNLERKIWLINNNRTVCNNIKSYLDLKIEEMLPTEDCEEDEGDNYMEQQ